MALTQAQITTLIQSTIIDNNSKLVTPAIIRNVTLAINDNAGITSVAGKTGVVVLTKSDVSLSNVDNTSDVNKPVSTAQATAIALKEPLITAGNASQYYRGDKSMQTLDKTAVGLSNVDNTSDANKPISSATQTALNLKATASSLSVVASTGAYSDLSGKPTIPAAQVNSDWNASSGVSQITNKPTLATVATSGNYADLATKPTYTVLTSLPGSLAGYVDGSEIIVTG